MEEAEMLEEGLQSALEHRKEQRRFLGNGRVI